jgi:copper chaperone
MGNEKNKAVIKVKGMTCGHCVAAVEKALGEMDGIGRVNVSLASGEVSVEYDPGQTPLEDIKAAINDLGYTCQD